MVETKLNQDQIAQQHATLLSEHETKMTGLTPERRKMFFLETEDGSKKFPGKDELLIINLLTAEVDKLKGNPAKRREYFLAHPELLVRFSAANFVPLEPNTNP